MYEAISDPYCYPGSTVLINRLDIRDAGQLEAFEEEMTRERAAEPLPNGRLSVSHFLAVHRHLFQDVYSWAGRTRTVRISKGGSVFCYPQHIAEELRKLFGSLHERRYLQNLGRGDFAVDAAHFLAELNAIHAFRDGNGRAQLAFLALLASRAGHPIELTRLEPEAFLSAMVASFQGDEQPLAQEIRSLIEPAVG